jgi:hypothetical protein
MAPPKSPDEARANDLAQKSESMARELSQKREMRIRQERVRHLSSDDAPPVAKDREPKARTPRPGARPHPTTGSIPAAEDKTQRVEEKENGRPRPRPEVRDTRVEPPPPAPRPSTSPPFYPERRASMLDDVATELEELLRDMRAAWRRWAAADRITFFASLLTMVGVLLPWTSDGTRGFQLGIVAGGAVHAALAASAIALTVGRARRYDGRGERLGGRERESRARRASLWHLLLGAASTVLCAYFLVIYGMQRASVPGLEIRFGLYVTLAAGMGLSYGGFARFFGRQHE